MPEVVARGREPEVFACGFCHRADGPGGPENANIAGLPAACIVQQMAGLTLIAPGHCTGWRAVNALANAYGDARVAPLAVGKVFAI